MFSHMFLLFQLLLLVFLQNCYLLFSQRQYIVHAPPCFWCRTRGYFNSFLLTKILELTLSCVSQATQYVATWVQLVRRVAQEPSVRGSNPSGARVQSNEGLGSHMSNQGTHWRRFLAQGTVGRRVASRTLGQGSNPRGVPQLGVGAPHVQSGYT